MFTACLLLSISAGLVSALQFSSVAIDIGLGNASVSAFTFADFNSDKATDFLLLNYTGQMHSVYLWDKKKDRFRDNPVKLDVPPPVVTADAADFDGDGLVDLLTHSGSQGSRILTVHWMALSNATLSATSLSEVASCPYSAHPLVLDYNGDHLPDILLVGCEGLSSLSVWLSNGGRRNFTMVVLNASYERDGFLPTAAFYLDINSDCLADLLVMLERGGDEAQTVDVWLRDGQTGRLAPHSRVELTSLPGSSAIVAGPTFSDMDGDGVFDLVYLVCVNRSCYDPSLHVLYQTKVEGVDVVNCQTSSSWEFSVSQSVNTTLQGARVHRHTSVAVGDVDLDGYPDVLLTSSTPSHDYQPRPLILLGGPIGKLRPQWDLFEDDNVSMATYFDLWEDGVLDVLGLEAFGEEGGGGGGRMAAYRQRPAGDHTFLKVFVLSGYCFSDCAAETEPYGSVLPGATVAFSTSDRNGNKERSVAVVQSGGSQQQLPFVVFGLGETPNFIEDLTIGAGYSRGGNDSTVALGYHQWSLLVPNSQVIVITTPPNMASKWRVELYLTPSQLVYSTAAVLCGIAIATAVIAALLQAREKYQDSKEKKQAKHRFHFNAM